MQAEASCVDAAINSMRQSNAKAAEIFLQNNVLTATDVTGFGLARHAQNLAIRHGKTGCIIDLSKLPLLGGVTRLLTSGIKSSLHEQNRLAVKFCGRNTGNNTGFEALFDPQTSGGLLGVFAASDANDALKTLLHNHHQAAIIGRLEQETDGLTIVNGRC